MTEKVKPCDWLFKDKIAKIVSKNCKEIPYEGTEVDKNSIVEEIMNLLTNSKEYSVLRHTINKK